MRFAHSRLSAWFQGGAVVLTPSALLAAVIQKQYAETQIAQSQSAWHPAPAFRCNRMAAAKLARSPLPVWHSKFRHCCPPHKNYSSGAEVIEKTALSLFRRGGYGANSSTAFRGPLRSRNVPTAHPAWADNSPRTQQAFLDWRNAVRQECTSKTSCDCSTCLERFVTVIFQMPLPAQGCYLPGLNGQPGASKLAARLGAADVPVRIR